MNSVKAWYNYPASYTIGDKSTTLVPRMIFEIAWREKCETELRFGDQYVLVRCEDWRWLSILAEVEKLIRESSD